MSLFWRTVSPPQIDCIDISSRTFHRKHRNAKDSADPNTTSCLQSIIPGIPSRIATFLTESCTTSMWLSFFSNPVMNEWRLTSSLRHSHFFPRMIERLRSKFLFNRSRTAFDFMYNHLSGVESADFLNPPFRLVDIWNMSIKRPEAHLNPPDDCLHFCYTGITDYWQKVSFSFSVGLSANLERCQLIWKPVAVALAYDYGGVTEQRL